MDTTSTEIPRQEMLARPGVDIAGIMRMLPHRYPMLLVDRVVDIITGESGTGIKNVTYNENFFQGHFPAYPVMPGVLIIEAMAQTAAVLVMECMGQDALGKVVYFMSIDNAKFRRPVVPGDQLRIYCQKVHRRGSVWRFKVAAKVEERPAADAVITAMIVTDKNGTTF